MNNKIFAGLFYFYAIVFSILKTLRLPNQWSQAHWLVDYRFGFIKRGLGGEIFGWFFEKSQCNIFILSGTISFLLYISLLTIAIKQTAKSPLSIYRILFFLVFFLSQYLVYSAHLIGYMDNLIFLIGILAIQLIKSNKILYASILAAFCVLLHELSFLLIVPICIFAMLVNNISEEFLLDRNFKLSLFKKIFLFITFPFITTILLSCNQEFYGIENRTLILDYLNHSGFIDARVASSVSDAYTESFRNYLMSESSHFVQRIFISKASIIYGVPIFFLMFLIYKEFGKVNFKILLLLLIISLLPLLIHAIAWDTYRIWTFPFIILFFGFWILSSKFNATKILERKFSTVEITFLIISVLFTVLLKSPLMDGCVERFELLERILFSIPFFLFIFIIIKKRASVEKK